MSKCDELLEALEAALEWIDAVPADTVLPAMPGFDRDWVGRYCRGSQTWKIVSKRRW